MIFAFLKRYLPHVYVNVYAAPDTVAVTLEEGGEWREFPLGRPPSPKGWRVHSILFDDGSIWDGCNGWRAEGWRVNESWIVRRDGKRDYWFAGGRGWLSDKAKQ